jgi:acetate kinase
VVSESDQILVLNAGSATLKLGLFAAPSLEEVVSTHIEWDPHGPGADVAVRSVLDAIDVSRVAAVGHRVVHGGMRLTAPVVIDAEVRATIAALAPLAPLHNGPALKVIDAVSNLLPDVPQVAAFDTAFHATLPPHAYTYALPYAWFEEWGIRRFGFHGISHADCAGRAAELLGQPLTDLKIVSCHLGGGCSLTAIAGGESIATTMGFTPLDGIVMTTRPGALDPGVLTSVLANRRVTLEELETTLHHRSGLKGIAGGTGDMRDILARHAAGDERAALAFDVYVARLREGIAAMAAALEGIDALVFTGGVGEHAAEVRSAACAGFGWIGLDLDEAANRAVEPDGVVSRPDSRVAVVVVRAREAEVIARETARVLGLSQHDLDPGLDAVVPSQR